MKLPELAVNRPVTTCMVFVAVVVLGAVSLSRLAIDLLPEIDFPSISVFTSYEGVGPEEMETLITRPIEEAVSRVQGIDRIESFSAEGRSRVALRFVWGTELDTAMNDVRAAVERLRDDFPEEAEPPVVFKFDLSSFPIMMLTLSGEMEPWKLRQLAEETLTYSLERVEGVAAVDVRGGLKREIHIDLDAERLAAHGLTANEVAEALRYENVNLPAGDVRERGAEVIVRTLGEFPNVEAMNKVVVAVREGTPVRVRDVGVVRDSYEKPTNVVLVDGQPGIRLSVSKLSGSNTVEVARRVRRAVKQINAEMPNIELAARFDTASYIEQSIANVEQGVSYGIGLAVLVLLLFLRSFRATAIVAVAIPIAGVGTFALMYWGNFTLNMITFGGLALGIGLLVDNSIVILENIQRHRESGEAPKTAAIKGAGEVSTAIIASTMTTLSIFVPVIFIGGFAGIFFGQMAFVVSFALICALAVALTLVPVMASWGRGRQNHQPQGRVARALAGALEAIEQRYTAFLAGAVNRPKTVYAVATMVFLASLALSPLIGTELMTEGDQGEIQGSAELPVGTPLETTEEVIKEVQAVIEKTAPEHEATMSIGGPPGFWSSDGANAMSLRISLVDRGDLDRSADEVAGALRGAFAKIPDFKARVRAGERFWLFRMLRGGGERLSVDIRGFDVAIASRLARQVAAAMESVEGVTDVDVDRKEGAREAVVEIDTDKAADLGLSVGAIGDAVSTYVLGKAATYYREAGDEFRVLVRLREEDRQRASQLERLPIFTPAGERLMLGDIANIQRREGPIAIRRLNQERIITVSGGFAGRDLGSVMNDLGVELSKIAHPDTFSIAMGGEVEEQRKAFGELVIGLLLALVLVYMVMASLFESLVHPFVMLFAIPFALVGIVLSLLITGTTLNVNSFLGAIVLVGVVVNNAIVLVDYVNLLRREYDMELVAAVVEASRRRLRPILMTTLTTALALFPVALGLGEGGELQSPLARVVVGGLLASTLITLVFVPTFYITVEKLRARLRVRAGGSTTGRVAFPTTETRPRS